MHQTLSFDSSLEPEKKKEKNLFAAHQNCVCMSVPVVCCFSLHKIIKDDDARSNDLCNP